MKSFHVTGNPPFKVTSRNLLSCVSFRDTFPKIIIRDCSCLQNGFLLFSFTSIKYNTFAANFFCFCFSVLFINKKQITRTTQSNNVTIVISHQLFLIDTKKSTILIYSGFDHLCIIQGREENLMSTPKTMTTSTLVYFYYEKRSCLYSKSSFYEDSRANIFFNFLVFLFFFFLFFFFAFVFFLLSYQIHDKNQVIFTAVSPAYNTDLERSSRRVFCTLHYPVRSPSCDSTSRTTK